MFSPLSKPPSSHPFSYPLTHLLPSFLVICLLPFSMVRKLSCVLISSQNILSITLTGFTCLSLLRPVEVSGRFLPYPTNLRLQSQWHILPSTPIAISRLLFFYHCLYFCYASVSLVFFDWIHSVRKNRLKCSDGETQGENSSANMLWYNAFTLWEPITAFISNNSDYMAEYKAAPRIII